MKNRKRYSAGAPLLLWEIPGTGAEPIPLPEGGVTLTIPNGLIWIGAILFLLLACGGVWLFFYLKRLRRMDRIFRAMPAYAGVVDGTGKIHFFQAPVSGGSASPRALSDLPDEIQQVFREPVREVLQTGKLRKVEYSYLGSRRRAELIRLPEEIVGVAAVMWTSVDIDEIDQQNILLKTAAEVGGMAYFRCSRRGSGMIFDITHKCEFWPVHEGGLPWTVEEWIAPDDQEPFHAAWRKLYAGERDSFSITYSAGKKDRDRIFEMRVITRPFPDGDGDFFGIIRDITEAVRIEQQRADWSMMFGTLLDNLPCGVFVKDVDDDLRFTICNRICGVLSGHTVEEMLGHRDGDILPADEAETVRRHDREAVEAAGTLTVETMDITATSGQKNVGRFYRNMLVRADGHRIIFGICLDVTGEVERERELQANNQLLQAIQESLPCAFFVKDADNGFRYVMCNRTYADFLGVTCAEIIGKYDTDLPYPPENIENCRHSDLTAMESGTCDGNELLTINREEYTFRCIKTRLIREDGRRLLLGICVDITGEKHLQAQLQRLTGEQKIHVEQEQLFNSILEKVTLQAGDDDALQEILRAIISHLGAMTSYIFHSDFTSGMDIPVAEYWPDEHGKTVIPSLPVEPGAVWFKMVNNHEIFEVPETGTAEAGRIQSQWAQYMPAFGVRALFGIGIWLDKKFWGYMGFSYAEPRGNLTAQEKFLFRSAAHMVEIILERRNSRLELDRSEYEKHLILDTMSVPIMLFDPEMKLIRCNNAALKVAGKSEDEVYRIGCREAFCGESRRPEDCPVQSTHDDLRVHTRELHRNGRDYHVRAHPIIIDGKLVYIMKTMIDVTDFNTVQKKLTSALEQAQEASKAKSYFLATMSHEIRTPLNAVIGFSELLKGGDLPEKEETEYLDAINLAGNSLLNLINDVLDLSKLEAEQTVITPSPTDVPELLREIQAVFQYKVQEKKLFFRFDCPSGIPVLKLDNLRLRQILLNLIGNAVKFTEQGGITLAVEFRRNSGAPDGTLSIRVADTGIGITGEAQKRIFQPFVQSDAVRDTHVYNGTGLGLAISLRLAERMGGRIQLESEVGKGSRFTLALDGIELAEPDSSETAEPAVPAPVESRKKRVLLVDDVPMNLKVLQAMLRKLDVESVCALSGREALDILETDTKFKLILTDLWMPEMDGEILARKIRGNPATAQMPVIVVTADAQIPAEKAQVFQGTLLKPLTREALLKALGEYRGM